MTEQVLSFTIGDSNFCVGIEAIREIVSRGTLTTVPNTPTHVRGVMDLRGETTTIIDPTLVFGAEESGDNDRVIIFEATDGQSIGWLVDQVHEVATIAAEDVESVTDDPAIRGIVRREDGFVIWVDHEVINSTVEYLRPIQ